jgi:hypothetical protein
MTPADEILVKKSQLKRSDRHALSGATKRPITNTNKPTTAKTMHNNRSLAGSGRDVPARISSREGMWKS